jgi:DNA-binding MarR family transcriptional regulator
MNTLEKSLMDLIWTVSKFVKKPKFIESCGDLNPAESKLFEFVKPEEKVTMGDLAISFGSSKGATSLLLNKLVKKKIATRSYDKADRRIVYISLTKTGERFYRAYWECKSKVLYSICESIKGYDQKLCMDILEKIALQLKN